MGLSLTESSVLFLDTAPFIYFFERNPTYIDRVAALFEAVYEAGARVTTSLITYVEIITVPARAGDRRALTRYRDYFVNSELLSLQPMNLTVAEETARSRAKYGLKPPDAIQLATAESCGADYVVTNDRGWANVDKMEIVQVSDL